MASSPAAPAFRPNNTAIIAIFASLATAGAWFMRVVPIFNDIPIGFTDAVEIGIMPNGTPIKKHYTGIAPVDTALSMLVAAFLSGPTGWDASFYWQQFHFLGQIASIIAIMNVEACREGNQGSWLKFTAIYAFLYQNIGGAVIIPIWWILFHRVSGKDSYFASGRSVPLPYARSILPATIFLYIVPTIAIFLPGNNLITLQNLLAFWQLTPVFVNIPLWFSSPFVSSAISSTTSKKNADLPRLRRLYGVLFLCSVAVHWYTIYGISTSPDPSVTYASVWMPSTYKWKNSQSSGLLYIFQCDWIFCGLAHVIPAWIAIYDVQRLIHGALTVEQWLESGLVVVALTWLAGPGAALAAVWGWREQKLASIEARFEAGTVKKGQ